MSVHVSTIGNISLKTQSNHHLIHPVDLERLLRNFEALLASLELDSQVEQLQILCKTELDLLNEWSNFSLNGGMRIIKEEKRKFQ